MKVLVVFDNGIGNFILMTPAVQALKKFWKYGSFVMTISQKWSAFKRDAILFQARHLMDDFVTLENVNASEYDEVFGTVWSAPRSFLSMYTVPFIGYSPMGKCMHERDFYMSVVHKIGYDGPVPPMEAFALMQCLPPSKHFRIVVCNDSYPDMRRAKIYGKMDMVINKLRKCGNFEFIGLGQPDGRDCNFDYDLRGKLRFEEMISVIAQSDMLLCNDTGLMHAASALGKPIVAVFGPTNEWKNGPLSGTVISRDVDCRPCFHTSAFTRCGKRVCMNVEPDAVVDGVLEGVAR